MYDPHVFDREDGSQILVSIFTDEQGRPTSLQIAERPDRYASWGPPIRESADVASGLPS